MGQGESFALPAVALGGACLGSIPGDGFPAGDRGLSLLFLPMIRFWPSAALFCCTVACGLSCSFYGREITKAPTLKAAVPFAVPFAFLASSAGFSFALSVAALADAKSRAS